MLIFKPEFDVNDSVNTVAKPILAINEPSRKPIKPYLEFEQQNIICSNRLQNLIKNKQCYECLVYFNVRLPFAFS